MGNFLDFGNIRPAPQTNAELLQALTPRQLEVLAMLCEGLPNKLIARRLDISSGTVKVHIVHILRALKVSSRLQAVLLARGLGFTPKAREVPAAPRLAPVAAPAPVLSAAREATQPPMLGSPCRIRPMAPRQKAAVEESPLLLGALMSKRLDMALM
jgi:DNA-binding CsgD family transcriptional regulator